MKSVLYSWEEKLDDYKDINRMLREGAQDVEIIKYLGVSNRYYYEGKNYLLDNNLITLDIIKEAREKVALEKQKELDDQVFALLNAGKSEKAITKKLHISHGKFKDSIARLDKRLKDDEVMCTRARRHKERIELTEKYLNDGKSAYEIKDLLGVSISSAKDYIKIIKDRDKTLEEKEREKQQIKEQKELLETKKQMILAMLEFNVEPAIIATVFDTTIAKINGYKRRNCSHLSKEETFARNEKILALIELNVPYEIISKEFGVSLYTIYGIKAKKENYHKPKKVLSEDEEILLKLLKEGYTYFVISKLLHVEQSKVKTIVKVLVDNKYITYKEIDGYCNNRRDYYYETTIKLFNSGFTRIQIFNYLNHEIGSIFNENYQDDEEVPFLSQSFINELVKSAIIDNRIDLDKAKENMDNNETTVNYRDKKVLSYLKQGLYTKDIMELEPKMSRRQIEGSIARLMNDNIITKEEIDKYILNRKQEILESEEEEIWYYIKNYGLDYFKIAKILDVGRSYVCERVKSYTERKKISQSQLHNIKKHAINSSEGKKLILYQDQVVYNQFAKAKKTFIHDYNDDVPKDNVCINYFEEFQNLAKTSYAFDVSEVDILSYVVMYTKSISTLPNLYTVIINYLYLSEFEKAYSTLNTYVDLYGYRESDVLFRIKVTKVIEDYQNGSIKKLENLI